MEMIARISINAVLLFVCFVLLFKALSRSMKKHKIPDKCQFKMIFVTKWMVIWCFMFLLLTFDWITHGRMFIMPVQLELSWSALMLLTMAINYETLKATEECPIQKPLGQILVENGVVSNDDIEKALKMQIADKKSMH